MTAEILAITYHCRHRPRKRAIQYARNAVLISEQAASSILSICDYWIARLRA